MSGTSVASPVVAGAAALLRAAGGRRIAHPGMLKSILLASADRLAGVPAVEQLSPETTVCAQNPRWEGKMVTPLAI